MIAGAGCAGLSLAWYLVKLGVEEPILLVDGRSAYRNDRTWCFWDAEPTPFQGLAEHAWHSWDVISPAGSRIRQTSSSYSYLRIPAISFYENVLRELGRHENVALSLNNPIAGMRKSGGDVCLSTGHGQFRGAGLIDSAGVTSRRQSKPAIPSRLNLLQHFHGLTIETKSAVFDTRAATLMDFRTPQSDGLHFFYVLPFTPARALIENTYFFPCQVTVRRFEEETRAYLEAHFGLRPSDYRVISRESGAIPLRPPVPHRQHSGAEHRIGLCGGAARPSSGYAFLRIQRQCRTLAEALIGQRTPPHRSAHKYDFLDTVFLEALAGDPQNAYTIFLDLFAKTGPDDTVRFLSDVSGLRNDLAVVKSLPLMRFALSALRSAPVWLRHLRDSHG